VWQFRIIYNIEAVAKLIRVEINESICTMNKTYMGAQYARQKGIEFKILL